MKVRFVLDLQFQVIVVLKGEISCPDLNLLKRIWMQQIISHTHTYTLLFVLKL